VRIRLPYYVKLVLSSSFPRMQVTCRVGRAAAVYVGPFRNRSTAVEFEARCLDLFQLRRCEDDLAPNPDHPGCMYGEMGKCLRPCQMAVGVDEYRAEAARVADFLRTGGKSLLEPAANARERLSADLDFEAAALMHERYRRIEEAVGTRDEMARDLERLYGIAVMPSAEPNAVELGWLQRGRWGGFARLDFETREANPVSLDARLRELASAVMPEPTPHAERMEQLAILSRWFYSSWRDGEMLIFDDWEKIPYRKLVNAVSRVAAEQRRNAAPDASR
jgi:excinuclease UvrABC nuclease subunit